MDERHRASAARARSSVQSGVHDRAAFRAALFDVPVAERDTWVDLVLGLDGLHDDGPELPRDCVPYLPCPAGVLVRIVDEAAVGPSDVFVDVGSGSGRAASFVHLLSGAPAIGIEVQPALVLASRDLASQLRLEHVVFVQGDATVLAGSMTPGSVFFLYCPFSGRRLEKVLDDLEPIARTRRLRVCCVDLPLPPRPWLARERLSAGPLDIYRSTVADLGREVG